MVAKYKQIYLDKNMRMLILCCDKNITDAYLLYCVSVSVMNFFIKIHAPVNVDSFFFFLFLINDSGFCFLVHRCGIMLTAY